MALKIWGQNDPVNHNDLNLNFVGLDLRLQTLEQLLAALENGGVITQPGIGTQLVFSDGSLGIFSDGSPILLSS